MIRILWVLGHQQTFLILLLEEHQLHLIILWHMISACWVWDSVDEGECEFALLIIGNAEVAWRLALRLSLALHVCFTADIACLANMSAR